MANAVMKLFSIRLIILWQKLSLSGSLIIVQDVESLNRNFVASIRLSRRSLESLSGRFMIRSHIPHLHLDVSFCEVNCISWTLTRCTILSQVTESLPSSNSTPTGWLVAILIRVPVTVILGRIVERWPSGNPVSCYFHTHASELRGESGE